MKKYVYLIKCENTDSYKIGISKNPQKRIKQLQVGHPDNLILIDKYLTENYNKVEIALHNSFIHLKKRGEWFEFGLTEELSFIDKCTQLDKTFISLKKSGNPFI